jgi:tetratricopeptide (TPR) repeat protein
LWSRSLSLAVDFPVWGAGLGTFIYVEPLGRTEDQDLFYTNAENEYLEALLEGGLVRLTISLAAVGLVFWYGCRAVRRHRGGDGTGLVLGALLSFTTMAVESFGDFGLHNPAIAFLATVLCAHMCGLGGKSAVFSLRLGGLAPVFGAALALVLAWVLCWEGWRAAEFQRLRNEAGRRSLTINLPRGENRIELLEAAAQLEPASARVQVELGLAYLERYRNRMRELGRKATRRGAAQPSVALALAATPVAPARIPWSSVPFWARLAEVETQSRQREQEAFKNNHLIPGLQHLVQARSLCPLLPEPHRCLAEHAAKLVQADARSLYLERAALLMPYDPVLRYLCGREYLEREPARAYASWRRSLDMSDLCLDSILEYSAQRLEPKVLMDRVLPARPRLLFRAAFRLYPGVGGKARRRAFLERALALLEEPTGPRGSEDFFFKALAHQDLDQPDRAVAAFREALARNPSEAGWRFQLARLLFRQRRLDEARRELRRVVAEQPENREAREFLRTLLRESSGE